MSKLFLYIDILNISNIPLILRKLTEVEILAEINSLMMMVQKCEFLGLSLFTSRLSDLSFFLLPLVLLLTQHSHS